MNPDSPKTPREEMETWLTALLLGELSEGEAAAVRELIKHDPELAKLHERLQKAIVLVREAEPEKKAEPAPEPVKLSDERRQRLMASFKIPPLKPEHRQTQLRRAMRLVAILCAVAITVASVFTVITTSESFRASAPDNYQARSAANDSLAEVSYADGKDYIVSRRGPGVTGPTATFSTSVPNEARTLEQIPDRGT